MRLLIERKGVSFGFFSFLRLKVCLVLDFIILKIVRKWEKSNFYNFFNFFIKAF